MDKSFLDQLYTDSRNLFFTDWLLYACELIAILLISTRIEKNRVRFFVFVYCCTAFIHMVSVRFITAGLAPGEIKGRIIEYSNIIFSVIEYSVFYYFFRQVIRSGIVKFIMTIFFAVLVLAVFTLLAEILFTHTRMSFILEYADYIISPELLFLGILCLVYFTELFKEKKIYNFMEDFSFWIVSGLFFYAMVIPPFFSIINEDFLVNHRDLYHAMYALHFITFSLLFISIIKAFRCKNLQTI